MVGEYILILTLMVGKPQGNIPETELTTTVAEYRSEARCREAGVQHLNYAKEYLKAEGVFTCTLK